MMDLRDAINCIRVQKAYGTYEGAQIGRVVESIDSLVTYRPGNVVLFRREVEPSDSQMQMGEFMGRKQKPTGKVTLETPLSKAELEKERARGSLITTMRTCLSVPERYVEEIIVE